MNKLQKLSDIVYTPKEVAQHMVEHFKPKGRILDPCKGTGVFTDLLSGADWCEISDGKDFYDYTEKVDWIISNHPYSIFSDFLRHSFTVAENIVYLIPANKTFNSYKMMKEIADWGGIVEMNVIAPGSKLKFPIGFCIAAVHFKKGYKGDMKTTFMEQK